MMTPMRTIESINFSLVLAPHVMKVLGDPSKSGGTVSVRGEQLTMVARLIPTLRLLSKYVVAKCKVDLRSQLVH